MLCSARHWDKLSSIVAHSWLIAMSCSRCRFCVAAAHFSSRARAARERASAPRSAATSDVSGHDSRELAHVHQSHPAGRHGGRPHQGSSRQFRPPSCQRVQAARLRRTRDARLVLKTLERQQAEDVTSQFIPAWRHTSAGGHLSLRRTLIATPFADCDSIHLGWPLVLFYPRQRLCIVQTVVPVVWSDSCQQDVLCVTSWRRVIETWRCHDAKSNWSPAFFHIL